MSRKINVKLMKKKKNEILSKVVELYTLAYMFALRNCSMTDIDIDVSVRYTLYYQENASLRNRKYYEK